MAGPRMAASACNEGAADAGEARRRGAVGGRLGGHRVAGVARGARRRGKHADAVLAAAAELGYAISPAASSLATGRTGTVGVIVPFVDRWYFARLISGVERV